MSKRSATHISLRGKIYQYVRRVPQRVIDNPQAWKELFDGRPLFRVTLDTSVYADALEKGALIERRFDQLVMRATRPTEVAPPRMRSPTPHELGSIARDIRDSMVRDWRQTIKRATVDEEAREYLHWRSETAADEWPKPSPGSGASAKELEDARRYNRERQFNVAETSDAFTELVLAVRDGRTQAGKDVSDLLGGKSLPDAANSTLISSFGAARAGTGRRFSDVVEEQRKVSNFSRKTINKADRAQRLFIQLVGDKPLDIILPEDVHRFIDAVAAQRVGNSDRSVSRATVQSYLTQVSAPLAYAVERRWLVSNPAAGHKIRHWVTATDPVQTPPKRPFTTLELKAIFDYPWFSGCLSSRSSHQAGSVLLDDMRYWAPVVALYTGARAAELGGLKLSEILTRGAPHFIIQPNEYRRTKSGKARIVPLLDALVELGFLDYLHRVASTGSDRLFPDWECPKERGGSNEDEQTRWANSTWIRSFNRTVIPKVLPRQNAKARRSAVTFHSFRGSFKSLLFRSGSEKKANAVLGHEETKLDKAYLLEVTAEDLHREFAGARYEGFVLPSPVHPI